MMRMWNLTVSSSFLTSFLKCASLCKYIYRTNTSYSAAVIATSHQTLTPLPQPTCTSWYVVAWHSIGAALFDLTVYDGKLVFYHCPLWLDPGHVGGWEMKRRRSGRTKVFRKGLKLTAPTHCELLNAWKVCKRFDFCRSSTTSVIPGITSKLCFRPCNNQAVKQTFKV